MRWTIAAAVAVVVSAPLTATVAPLTPDQKLELDRRDALENAVRARFSDGTFNQVRDMYANVIVAQERAGRPTSPRVLFKDEHGWQEVVASGRRPLSRHLAHELDRLLIQPDLWTEAAYNKRVGCAEPQVFTLEYGGEQKYGRQCGSPGLTGRVASVAATWRIPPGKGATTATLPGPNDARTSLGKAEDLTGHVSARVREMVYSWDRRSLAGAVDPYAEDAMVQFADGRVLRGRSAIAAWMRPQQDWAVPGLATQGRIKGVHYQRGTIKALEGDIITELREIRWTENGRPLRRTYSANWRNNDGLWQIVHERVSEDKPVTDERLVWP